MTNIPGLSGLSDLASAADFGAADAPVITPGAQPRSSVSRTMSPPAVTAAVTRGVCRWMDDIGFSSLMEFKLGNGRRADVVGLNAAGILLMVEVKSTPEDFKGDAKWLEYVPYCDAFSFAVPPHFPWQILPTTCGVIIADNYSAAVVRQAPHHPLHASRRKALTLRFALAAGQRLNAMTDPRIQDY